MMIKLLNIRFVNSIPQSSTAWRGGNESEPSASLNTKHQVSVKGHKGKQCTLTGSG